MKLTAKKVSDNFWIMRLNGRKVGNIQVDATGVVVEKEGSVERFARLEDIARKYAVEFVRYERPDPEPTREVLGYPTRTLAHNPEWDLQLHLPLYTTDADSRSKRCAGYYMVNHNDQGWRQMWCPKLITVRRSPHHGPFQTREALDHYWNQHADNTAHSAV